MAELDIDDWRKEIDLIDERLIELLNRRSQCAIEIGRIKRRLDLAIYSPERETEVFNHVIGLNGGPLEPDAVRRLFERIIDESRRIERVTVERETTKKQRVGDTSRVKRAGKRKPRSR